MTDDVSPLAEAFNALRDNQPELAEQVCDDLLVQAPNHAHAWYVKGISLAQRDDIAAAADSFQKAVDHKSDSATYQYNLGRARSQLHQVEAAVTAYQAAIELKPEMLEARNNLGNCLVNLQRTDEAAEVLRKTATDFPDEAIVHFNLANVLEEIGEYREAIEAYQKAIELDPDFDSARDNLGRTHAGLTDYDSALRVWKDWLEQDPSNPIPRHMIAGITGEQVPVRCDDDYVLNTFDDTFAASYENQLHRIGYSVPDLVAEAIKQMELPSDGNLNVLDAGCGTGLCSPILRPFAKSLSGIDLSPDMLRLADQTQRYDQLIEGELTAVLTSLDEQFDLVVFGDTLCYFGDLTEVLSVANQCTAKNATLVFTAEKLSPMHEDEQIDETVSYRLLPNGRYQHSERFVNEALQAAGWQPVSVTQAKLRMERGREVTGLVVTANNASS
ncbi:tetratricopeptide repeat protein [Rhodopirellula sp. MGV]|uniref:tetratricopeptide repeat protein n=1 Tax=Rhodopirellula sp. MGV TaxID=2023130 RepID=UPI000BD2AD37|nr:tetratricopeptide repeat protein [Rhodopirellula sp. MGV]OYP36538.1 hypothetical protein CGZ80_07850 [Rhodopirellula sp. MGV]